METRVVGDEVNINTRNIIGCYNSAGVYESCWTVIINFHISELSRPKY
jgi:hypothetical protein